MITDSGYILYHKISSFIERGDTRIARCVFAMEGTNSIRKQEYHQYKAQRVITDTTRYVADLRVRMHKSYPNLLTIKGYEADDVIALYVYLTGDNHVVGLDKDLLQIPSINLVADGKQGIVQKTIGGSPNLVAKTVYHHMDVPLNAYQWILYLTLIGDKSDNIPRLVDKLHYGYETIVDILSTEAPFRKAYEMYGDRFLRNFGLVLLPHYRLLKISQMELIDILDHFLVNLPSENWLASDMVLPNVVDYILSTSERFKPQVKMLKNEYKFYANVHPLYKYITGLTEI